MELRVNLHIEFLTKMELNRSPQQPLKLYSLVGKDWLKTKRMTNRFLHAERNVPGPNAAFFISLVSCNRARQLRGYSNDDSQYLSG